MVIFRFIAIIIAETHFKHMIFFTPLGDFQGWVVGNIGDKTRQNKSEKSILLKDPCFLRVKIMKNAFFSQGFPADACVTAVANGRACVRVRNMVAMHV